MPSNLIGHRLGGRVYDDRIDLFLSGTHLLTLPRASWASVETLA